MIEGRIAGIAAAAKLGFISEEECEAEVAKQESAQNFTYFRRADMVLELWERQERQKSGRLFQLNGSTLMYRHLM